MSELYLVAHKVRGEVAFDVAIRMCCPECADDPANDDLGHGCPECDKLGYWWIIPTSGARAYPYAFKECEWDELSVGLPPDGLPDHYPARAAPAARPAFLDNLLRKPSVNINRRGL